MHVNFVCLLVDIVVINYNIRDNWCLARAEFWHWCFKWHKALLLCSFTW